MLAAQYVKWANKTDLDDFWTDPKVKRLYKNHIYAMTSRTNVYNGEWPGSWTPVVGPHQGLWHSDSNPPGQHAEPALQAAGRTGSGHCSRQ